MKLRLGMALACVALLAGCPDAANDQRASRGGSGDPTVIAEVAENQFVCTNYRRWREDLDLPAYLAQDMKGEGVDERENPDLGTSREARKKAFIVAREGTYTVCHQPLVDVDVNANRGQCKVCTEMLTNPAWLDPRVAKKPGPVYDQEDPVKLLPEQAFTDKIEFRLKWVKEDYVTKADEQIASYREWIAKRNPTKLITGYDTSKQPAEPIIESDPAKIVEIYVQRATAKGMFTKDEANPKNLPKFGLPPLAEPFIACPKCQKPVNPTESKCWNCNTFYTLSHKDERNAIAEPHEALCPSCNQPVDPTLNWCDNPQCRKCPTHGAATKYTKGPDGELSCSQCGTKLPAGSFHRAIDTEGPCWRCGGSHVCPECMGSGKGHGPIQGADDCWMCGPKTAGGSNGACPECDARGFTIYDGALPAGFKGDKRDYKKDWRLKPAAAGAAKKQGAEDGGDKGGEKPGDKGGEKPEKEEPPK